MKKFKRFSKNKYLIILNLFLIATLMTASVYAWFASHVENTVTAYDIQVESDDALELSFTGEDNSWSGSLNLADLQKSDGTNVLESMKLVEITSDGFTSFRIPELQQKGNYAVVVEEDASWDDAEANQDYIEFTVYMRSEQALSVYLSSDSCAEPACGVDNVKGADCGNPSIYADGEESFSKDCIVGALRLSFNDYIWITNPEYHLNNTVGTKVYTMTTDATESSNTTDGTGQEGSDFIWNDSYKHYYYSGNTVTTATNVITELPNTTVNKPTDTSTLLATLTKAEGAEFYEGSVTFRLWIEGCDTEARRALVDGKFNLALVLDTF